LYKPGIDMISQRPNAKIDQMILGWIG